MADKTNRPHLLPRAFQSRKNIGGNSHENCCLSRLIPLIVGELIPEDEPVWQIILDSKDIVDLVVCPIQRTLGQLVDCYPLCDYEVGTLRMVTLKRYIHSSGNIK